MRAGGTELNSEQLKGIAAGDSRAFQILYEAFAPRVYQYAMLRTGSPPDSEEILQETMLAVWNSRSQVVSRSSVGAWIFSIARNKTVDLLRRNRIRMAVALDEEAASAAFGDEDRTGLIDAKAALAQLGEEERDLVWMVFLLEMTYEEVGEALGIPVGTVKSRMHHLRRKLKAGIERRRGDGDV